jgi:hypothetical protein
MSKNRYTFATTLEGFVQVFEDSGKFNNRAFSFKLPADVVDQAEQDRTELLEWAKSKTPNPRRCEVALPKWDDEGLVKYSYGGETKRPEPVFVDTNGDPIDRGVLKDIRKGTKVRLIVQQSPYAFGSKVGTKFKVLGVQIVELVTHGGAADSGDLSVDDIAGLFGKVEGFKGDEPAVRKADTEETTTTDSYDF